MTDGQTDVRTDGGDCNIPDAFFNNKCVHGYDGAIVEALQSQLDTNKQSSLK